MAAVAVSICVLAIPVAAQNVSKPMPFATGLNIAGAEFGDVPGVYGKDYIYPSEDSFAHAANHGFGIVRLPLRWERLEPQLGKTFDLDELHRLDVAVDLAETHGLQIIIDIHNYSERDGVNFTDKPELAGAFADLWRRLSIRYGQSRHVVFGIMNEPQNIDSDLWAGIAQETINVIRSVGAQNLILVPGTHWTNARRWTWPVNGRPNSEALRDIQDSCRNFAIEVHEYFDGNSSGTSDRCVSISVGSSRIADLQSWLRETGYQAFLGEFGASTHPVCMTALEDMMSTIQQNRDLWIGWTYWAAGPWWPADYPFSVEPVDGEERPQMELLAQYAERPSQDFFGCKLN